MTKRERVLATLSHREPDIIPNHEGFFDSGSREKFIPKFDDDPLERRISYLEFMDNYIAGVGGGGLRSKVIERGDNYHILEWENGAKWRIREKPYNRSYIDLPIKEAKDVERMSLPEPNDSERYKEVEGKVRFFKERGYFTMAGVNGFFSGIWYFCRRHEDFMSDLILNPNLIEAILERLGFFNLQAAENLLRCGADCISFVDDLGGSERMFISPRLYRKFFLPWHARLAELCHKYGGFIYMHSHGAIMPIVGDLVDAGVDILNPVGPTDSMNLRELKRTYGKRITFCGGISKYLAEMSLQELDQHLEEVVRIGSEGGGFITSSEGGIPYTMEREKFLFYMERLKLYRCKYGGRNEAECLQSDNA